MERCHERLIVDHSYTQIHKSIEDLEKLRYDHCYMNIRHQSAFI